MNQKEYKAIRKILLRKLKKIGKIVITDTK